MPDDEQSQHASARLSLKDRIIALMEYESDMKIADAIIAGVRARRRARKVISREYFLGPPKFPYEAS